MLRQRNLPLTLLACAAAAVAVAWYVTRPASAAEIPAKKIAIPFDFLSKYDKGVLGNQLGDMVWKKLDRDKVFIVTESMKDVRDFCESKKFQAAPDTPMDVMKKMVKEDFGADIGIWGGVELAPGETIEIYDIVLKCVDFSVEPPKVVYDKKARTNSAAEIPHLYVKEMLDALYERKPGEKIVNAYAEQNWKDNPNMVKGGDFEHGRGGHPEGWDPFTARPEYYKYVKWTTEKGNAGNKVIQMDIPKGVAESTGVLYYSEFIKIQEGATYRFQCRYRTNGPAPKIFIKCYDEMASEYVAASKAKAITGTAAKKAGSMYTAKGSVGGGNSGGGPGDDILPSERMFREIYRSQQNLKGPKNEWNTQTEDFTPKHTKYSPKRARVMLYGYLGEGLLEWDDVVIKEIIPSTTSAQIKDKRHSLETKVTLKEMEENERRSNEEKARQKAERDAAKAAGKEEK